MDDKFPVEKVSRFKAPVGPSIEIFLEYISTNISGMFTAPVRRTSRLLRLLFYPPLPPLEREFTLPPLEREFTLENYTKLKKRGAIQNSRVYSPYKRGSNTQTPRWTWYAQTVTGLFVIQAYR